MKRYVIDSSSLMKFEDQFPKIFCLHYGMRFINSLKKVKHFLFVQFMNNWKIHKSYGVNIKIISEN